VTARNSSSDGSTHSNLLLGDGITQQILLHMGKAISCFAKSKAFMLLKGESKVMARKTSRSMQPKGCPDALTAYDGAHSLKATWCSATLREA
jgi:hypothetical protein